MVSKEITFRPRGMNRDLSESKASPDFAYEILNLRLNASEDNTFMSWVTERGPLLMTLYRMLVNEGQVVYTDDEVSILGTPIGYATIDNRVILFTTDDNGTDIIYSILRHNDRIYLWNIFEGPLGFSTLHPIETLPIYENENAVKVYWIDGINQPRVINVANYIKNLGHYSDDTTLFDFVSTINFDADITVRRDVLSSGVFAPGVIQYAFTYYNKFGSETNIFHVTPLNYISFNNRGASPEDILGNSFEITITNPEDNKFDYLRIYSIHRTSIDSMPTVKRLVDLSLDNIPANKKLIFTDTGEYGDIVDPTILLYVGGKEISAGAIELKDNTLFLGDIDIKSALLNNRLRKDNIEQDIRNLNVLFYTNDSDDSNKVTTEGVATNKTYVYKTQLDRASDVITTFKYGEYYRFGFLALRKTGEWSEPVFINDFQSDIQPQTIKNIGLNGTVTNVDIKRASAKTTLPDTIVEYLRDAGYINVRPLIVFPSITDRTVLCLGVLAPTVFNAWDRETNSPGVQSSWFFRPFPKETNGNSTAITGAEDISYDNHVIGLFIYGASAADYIKGTIATINIKIRSSDPNEGDEEYTVNVEVLGTSSSGIESDRSDVNTFLIVEYTEGIYGDTLEVKLNNALEAIILGNLLSGHSDAIIAYTEESLIANQSIHKLKELKSLTGLDYNNLILDSSSSSGSKIYYGTVINTEFVLNLWISNATITFRKELVSIILGAGTEILYSHHNSLFTWGNGIEIQSNADSSMGTLPYYSYGSKKDDKNWLKDYSDTYFVDLSILTFHSPDLEYDTRLGSIDSASGLKFKIVGIIPITGTVGDMNLTTSSLPYDSRSNGFKRQLAGFLNVSDNGYMGMCTMNNWKDLVFIGNAEYGTGDTRKKGFAYNTNWPVYPWHRSGSLNNLTIGWDDASLKEGGTTKYSVLKNKKMSNLRFSLWTEYTTSNLPTSAINIKDIKVFNSNEITNTRVSGYNYYGNVDKIIFVDRSISYGGGLLTTNGYKLYSASGIIADGSIALATNEFTADPISMRYKSTLHAVADIERPLSDKFSTSSVHQVLRNYGNFGYLLMVDLVNDSVRERFGGLSDFAILNNSWIIGGKSKSIKDSTTVDLIWTEGDTYVQRYDCLKTYPFTMEDTNSIVDILSFICETRINLDGRYDKNRGLTDNLLMSPVNFNKLNIIYSQRNNFFNYRVLDNDLFNFESHPYTISWSKAKVSGEKVDTWTNITLASSIDMDGDLGPLTAIRKVNDSLLVLLNKGISLLLYNENIPISTLNGVPLEVANSGKVTGKRIISDSVGCNNKWSICNTENAMYFVDSINKGIYQFSQKLLNISDLLGVGTWIRKVNLDKWNPKDFNGIRTVYDSNNKNVYFITNNQALAYSEPTNMFTSFYNYESNPYLIPIEGNLYWIAEYTSLDNMAFSKLTNLGYHMWKHNAGEYNKFFNTVLPYGITIIASNNIPSDKVFNTIEFRADVLDSAKKLVIDDTNSNNHYDSRLPNQIPFNLIKVWNEYLDTGEVTLDRMYGRPSMLKEKFRMWRANIPRCIWSTENGVRKLDRIRNPWTYIKLLNNNPETNKTIIHDLIVHYFE